MYRNIIVPVDGSPFAAQAVATAASIARSSGADLWLTRVHEAYLYEETDYSLAFDLSHRDQAEHLADVADFVEANFNIQAERRLLDGAVVPALCGFAEELEGPLIVMSTHGRTGFSRFWLGSIADGIVRYASTPVLMLKHRGEEVGLAAPAHPFARIVVPLDGSDVAECALPYAAALATAYASGVTLLRIVSPARVPAAAYAVPFAAPTEPLEDNLNSRVDAAQSYLVAVAARLEAEGMTFVVATDVRVAESSAPAILDAAKWQSADTIALATLGRGASRLLAPSIADKILRGGPDAVLIVRAPAQH
jgi:nucleotide-binding universal stress UspA family protein